MQSLQDVRCWWKWRNRSGWNVKNYPGLVKGLSLNYLNLLNLINEGHLRHAGAGLSQTGWHRGGKIEKYICEVFCFTIFLKLLIFTIFPRMDENNDGTLTEEEFLKGCLQDDELSKMLAPNVSNWIILNIYRTFVIKRRWGWLKHFDYKHKRHWRIVKMSRYLQLVNETWSGHSTLNESKGIQLRPENWILSKPKPDTPV